MRSVWPSRRWSSSIVLVAAICSTAAADARVHRCDGELSSTRRTTCMLALQAALELEHAARVEDDAVGLDGWPGGTTVPKLVAIKRYGADARPIWTQLAQSRAPVARAAAAIGLRAIDEPWVRPLLATLRRDRARVEWQSGCMGEPRTVAWFTETELAIVDQVRDEIVRERQMPEGVPAPPPEHLDKGQIVGAMSQQRAAVAACRLRTKAKGTLQVHVTFASSGHVTSAVVSGPLAGDPGATCVERVIRAVKAPAFTGAPQTVVYPFVFP